MAVQINQLSRLDELTDADLLAVWGSSVGDTRAAAMSVVYAYILSKLAASQATILAKYGVAVSAPVDTSEDILASIAIPANTIGASGLLRLAALLSFTNNANAKTVRVRLGGLTGTVLFTSGGLTNLAGLQLNCTFWNRSVPNVQVASASGLTTGNLVVGAAQATALIDTRIDQTLVITGQKATAGDTCTLESYLAEVIPGA